jgi:predicted Rossmann fold nucleotide-binding protein DprA/Smf involved in DNA uptake
MIIQPKNPVQSVQIRGVEAKLIGNAEILGQLLLGLFCSRQTPGELILKAFDLAKELRNKNIPVIGGFHSSIEMEMLSILMRGTQPIVICLARELECYRLPKEYRGPIHEGRLVLVSPFSGSKYLRITQETALVRNRLIGKLSSTILLIHAEPGGNIAQLYQEWIAENRVVFALDEKANQSLFETGVKRWKGTGLESQREETK